MGTEGNGEGDSDDGGYDSYDPKDDMESEDIEMRDFQMKIKWTRNSRKLKDQAEGQK